MTLRETIKDNTDLMLKLIDQMEAQRRVIADQKKIIEDLTYTVICREWVISDMLGQNGAEQNDTRNIPE